MATTQTNHNQVFDRKGNILSDTVDVVDTTTLTTVSTVAARAKAAITANNNYLAIGAPSNAQVTAQVTLMTKECTALIKMMASLIPDIGADTLLDTNGT